MLQPNRDRFYRQVVRNSFGTVVTSVAEVLLAGGPQTVKAITKAVPNVTGTQIRKSLLALMQHNIVQLNLGDESKPNTYHLHEEMIHYRICHPDYIVHISNKYGKEAKYMITEFCKHGKLSRQKLVENTTRHLLMEEYTIEERPEDDSKHSDAVVQAFKKLVKEQYIRKADTLTNKFETVSVSSKKKVGMEEVKAIPTKKRKRKTTVEVEKQSVTYVKSWEQGMFQTYDDEDADKIFWQLHDQKFMFELRNHELVDYVRRRTKFDTRRAKNDTKSSSKIDKTCLNIAECMLSKYPISGVKEQPKLYVNVIREMVNQKRDVKLSFEEILKKIKHLNTLSVFVKEKKGTAGVKGRGDLNAYLIDIDGILTQIQLQHACSVVEHEFGEWGARIFRLLHNMKGLLFEQIADMATIPRKNAQELLYKMMRKKYVRLQEVPRDSARTPTKTMHFWTVPFQDVGKELIDSFYFCWTNLNIRCGHEALKAKSVLEKLAKQSYLPPGEKEIASRWEKANLKLRVSMSNVARLIRLFRDYR